jgi:imidazole glycerol-phosphate synthase subunit HisH
VIAIVDYGLGNIRAFANVYRHLDIPFKIASKSDDLKDASKFVLPGVGAFDHAMEMLQKSGMQEPLNELVLGRRLPVLGICVGMQILALSSEEGCLPGLGWIAGSVKKLDPLDVAHKIHLPHMGWNNIVPIKKNTLMNGLDNNSRFYFLHSYHFQCHHPDDVFAVTDYGGRFTCAVNSGNVYGVQFHPEKSHQNGIQLLKNFGNLPQANDVSAVTDYGRQFTCAVKSGNVCGVQ